MQFTVRAFAFAHLMPGWGALTPGWRLILVNGPLIPLNYLLELGFFFLAGLIQFRRFRTRGGALSRHELASVVMAATSILICTFLRSSVIGNNDLGWRGFLIAQFVLLLWGVDILAEQSYSKLWRDRSLLVVFLWIGAAGTVFDLALTRFYPMLIDSGVIAPFHLMSFDRQLGKRTYANREAYEWARSVTPATAAIQFNPHVMYQDTPAMLYSERRFVASDVTCNTGFGGNPQLCAAMVSHLVDFYAERGHSRAESTQDICRDTPARLLIAKDSDPLWTDHGSWVWTEKPIFANRYIRLFGCPTAIQGGIASR